MADAGRKMTWEEKVDHWALTVMAPLVAAWGAVELTTRPEMAGRYAGAVLELLGVIAIAYGLQETLAQVTERPSIRERVASWFRQLWRRIMMMLGWEPEERTVTAGMTDEVSVSDEAQAIVEPGPDTSLEHRVEILEQEVEANRRRIGKIRQEAREGRDELKGRIGELRSELGDVEEELENLVQRQAVASLHWEATGLLWFAAGVIVATWPNLIFWA